MKTCLQLLAAAALAACGSIPVPDGPPEAVSLQGEALHRPPLEPEDLQRREGDLARARRDLDERPHEADALVEYGRRLGVLGRFREAIDVFARGIAEHPRDPRFPRYRGHRWITLRRFDLAEADLELAARLVEGRPDEPEPPMTPNARGVVLDTLNHSVFYHLALARFLRGDHERSLEAWQECAKWSKNPDSLCSVTHWTYTTLSRLGRPAEAEAALEPIRADLDVVEYKAYHRLCLAYRGEIAVDALWDEIRNGDRAGSDFPTVGFGLGHWHLTHGNPQRALEMFREVARTPLWPAFGRIAAEVELQSAPH